MSALSELRDSLKVFFSSRGDVTDVFTCTDLSNFSGYGEARAIKAERLIAASVVCPPDGLGGSVYSCDVLPEPLAARLQAPESWLNPPELWPAPWLHRGQPSFSKPVHSDEWEDVCSRLYSAGMLTAVDVPFSVGGIPVLSGCFGVPKIKNGITSQRFIANLAINEFCSRFSEGAACLPHPAQMVFVTLAPGEVMIVDEDDEVSCFNLYRLPDSILKILFGTFTEKQKNFKMLSGSLYKLKQLTSSSSSTIITSPGASVAKTICAG